MKTERKRDTAEGMGGDLKNGKVEGGAAVCDERLREGREEEERGGGESLHPPLLLAQTELQCGVHVTVGANEIIFPYLHLRRPQVMLSS